MFGHFTVNGHMQAWLKLRLKHSQKLGGSLGLAIVLHVVILLIQFNPIAHFTRSSDLIYVGILKEPVQKEPVEPDPNAQVQLPSLVESNTPEQDSPPKITRQEKTVRVKTPKTSVTQAIITVPSINSNEFKRFLDNETKKVAKADPSGLKSFDQTFINPLTPEYKDSKPEADQLLGGGNYKTRRNGIECESLTMVPQSFDELSGITPTVKTSGRCKDLKTKIKLTDKDGRIQNSDRVDWP